jgi:hypothetical protein
MKPALKSLHLSMVGAVAIAHLAREVAATDPKLTAPARVIAMRAQGEAEIAREQGITAYDGRTWASPGQVAANQVIPLPEPARRGLVNLANDVIASCNRTAATAAPLDPSACAATKTPVDGGRKVRGASGKKIPGADPFSEDHDDELRSQAGPLPRTTGSRTAKASPEDHGCGTRGA